jgi:Fusaric acid resistance protein-like
MLATVRAFDTTVGMSPMAYLRQMRVQRMARLLRPADLSIAATAGAELDPVAEPATEPTASGRPVTSTSPVSCMRPAPVALVARFDPGLANMRDAAVTMAATLASFATALGIERVARLSTSIVILAVALTLSIGRMGQRGNHRTVHSVALAAVVLPLVAVGANEISTRIFHQPNLGDALFVVAMSATIWLRGLGPAARQIATFATFPLVVTLIVPAPIVATNGSTADGRWWSALIALVALGWATATRFVAERSGILVLAANLPPPTPPTPSSARTGRRIAPSTRMALQMAAALAAAFAVGRSLFDVHWTWVVLTAFIVCSGTRGRGDVVHKAVMGLAGAAVGTLAATVLSDAFPPGDRWSIVIIFAVLAVALWLRSINYAYWAAGMTAALALLYGYYAPRSETRLAVAALHQALATEPAYGPGFRRSAGIPEPAANHSRGQRKWWTNTLTTVLNIPERAQGSGRRS